MVLNIKENEKVLVVAPHPDDESIGCGGLISKYAKQCDVLLVTDGKSENVADNMAEVREAEFVIAMELAGVNKYTCLRLPEGGILSNKKIIAEYDFSGYDYIFVPNRHEAHKDHIGVYKALKSIAGSKAPRALLMEYEVWTTIKKPNAFLDISDVYQKKTQMIQCHKSQTEKFDYVGMIMGLNAYRGRCHYTEYAEAYFCEKELKRQNIRRTKRKIKGIISKGKV